MSECTEKMCDNYCDGLCEVGCTPDVPDVVLKLQATLKEMEAENKRLSDAFEKESKNSTELGVLLCQLPLA